MVNPRHQTPQRPLVAKPENTLYNILMENLNTAYDMYLHRIMTSHAVSSWWDKMNSLYALNIFAALFCTFSTVHPFSVFVILDFKIIISSEIIKGHWCSIIPLLCRLHACYLNDMIPYKIISHGVYCRLTHADTTKSQIRWKRLFFNVNNITR